MSYLLCLLSCMLLAINAEYTGTLLDKTFRNKTREVQKFKTRSWKQMTAANLTTNHTESLWNDGIDRFLSARLMFRDDLCTVYDQARECHATQHNHTLRASLQKLAKMGKRRCLLGLTAPHNYTPESDLRRCLPQANVTSSCGTALEHCMQLSSRENDTAISRELLAYDSTNDISLVDSIVRPVTGIAITSPVSAILADLLCFQVVLGMTAAIEAAIMAGAVVASVLGAITLAVWETLRRLPYFQHRLHPTLEMSSNTSSILR